MLCMLSICIMRSVHLHNIIMLLKLLLFFFCLKYLLLLLKRQFFIFKNLFFFANVTSPLGTSNVYAAHNINMACILGLLLNIYY